MKYVSQRRYPHIPYPQFMDYPDDPRGKKASVRSGGCGLCSACMMIDQLTTKTLTVAECTKLSMDNLANHDDGTDMRILGPVLAEKFGLEYSATSDLDAAVAAVRDGGCVIILSQGDSEGHTGILSKGGHFVVMISATEDEVCILDPNWTRTKYAAPAKAGLVRLDGYFVYTSRKVVTEDAATNKPAYYIFKRR